jgi:hypothetical protein
MINFLIKRFRIPLVLIVAAGFFLFAIQLQEMARAQSTENEANKQPELKDNLNMVENAVCLDCHSKSRFTLQNPVSGMEEKHKMCDGYRIPSGMFYVSNHKTFKCIDCHPEDYKTFPHKGELRFEPKSTCLDCHEGDEQTAKYNFEKISEEFTKSVHSSKHSNEFTCWMCHNPHTYKISARTDSTVKNVIAYDNSICLSCHADIDKYQLITDKTNPSLIQKHEWLPNQALHFQNVRCIECHARVNDTLLVAHNIQPKEKAVKRCVECHSQNSILMSSLYRFQTKEKRNSLGYVNGVILNEAYVIGANRNFYLNVISIGLFCLVIIGIGVHATLRIIKKKS